MTVVMLYHKAGAKSGPRLARYMGIQGRQRLQERQERPSHIIRYGSKRRVPQVPSERTINRRRMLVRQPNRYEQLRKLDHAGVRVPPFAKTWHGLATAPHGFLARLFGSGDKQATGGYGITYFPMETGTPLPDDEYYDFYSQFVPKDRQFRVHVIGGETRTRELIAESDEVKDKVIWNYGNGFKFKYPAGKDIPLRVVPAAVQAVKALWLDFGAVDVITHNNVAYVLEVNTAPGLSDPTLEWYGEQLGRLVGLTDMPGWEAENLDPQDG